MMRPLPQFTHTFDFDDRQTLTGVGSTTATSDLTVPGVTDTGLVGVLIKGISCDRGLRATGSAINTVRAKFKPVKNSSLFGGDQWWAWSTLDTFKGNVFWFDNIWIDPDERMILTVQPGTASTDLDFVVYRRLLYRFN